MGLSPLVIIRYIREKVTLISTHLFAHRDKIPKFLFLSTSTEVYLPLRAGHSQQVMSPDYRS